MVAAIGLGIVLQQAAQACALEPMINGGFTVSHPQSINVAVAVAKARSDGLLPESDPVPPPNDVQLNRMLRDLRELNKRLDSGRKVMTERPRSFSLVLIGPGLWSHFHASPAAILARYHTDGPMEGKVTAVTHHAVLVALLDGSLEVDEALGRGLLRYADGNATAVHQLFARGFSESQQLEQGYRKF
jgi:hypothetical protein